MSGSRLVSHEDAMEFATAVAIASGWEEPALEERIAAKAKKWNHEWRWATWTDSPSEPGGAMTDEIDIRDIGHTVWTVVEVSYYLRDELAEAFPCECGRQHSLD